MKKYAVISAVSAALLPAAILLSAAALGGCGEKESYVEVQDIADSFPLTAELAGDNPQQASSDGPYAVIHTTAGDVSILLYPEQAPKAVENFIGLAKEGYYDGSSFYYAKRGELVQGGRPAALDEYVSTEAATKGEPVPEEAKERSIWGGAFEDEFDDGLHHYPGAVGMAGGVNGENQNLSQFYFLVQDTKAEDERVIPANLYMNELIRMKFQELNEKNKNVKMSEDELKQFEDDLNAQIQSISTDGIPEEYAKKYEPVVETYRKFGGAWSLDYKYTVFGQIIKGYNVARAMTEVKVDAANRKPQKKIMINGIEIVDELTE